MHATDRRLLAHKLHKDKVHGTPYGDFSACIAYLFFLDAIVSWIRRFDGHGNAESQPELESRAQRALLLLVDTSSSCVK